MSVATVIFLVVLFKVLDRKVYTDEDAKNYYRFGGRK